MVSHLLGVQEVKLSDAVLVVLNELLLDEGLLQRRVPLGEAGHVLKPTVHLVWIAKADDGRLSIHGCKKPMVPLVDLGLL